MPHPKNPYVIWNLRDLFGLAGPLATAFFAGQLAAALMMARFSMRFMEADKALPWLMGLFLILAGIADTSAFIRYRGRHYSAWSRPFLLLSLLTIAPAIACFLLTNILNLLG